MSKIDDIESHLARRKNTVPDVELTAQGDEYMRKVVGIVDDDPAMLKSIGRFLRAAGYDTELFSSGEELLGGLAASKATCLIIDIHLGEISGIELGQKLATLGFTVPVIFISGVANPLTERAASEVGCAAFLHKPFSAQVLVKAIEQGLQTAA